MRILWLLVLLAISVAAQSPTQKRFLASYGPPEQFILASSNGRTIEVWLYPAQAIRVTFDNGFFAKRDGLPKAMADVLPLTPFRPWDLPKTPEQMTQRFGKPAQEERAVLGPWSYRVFCYEGQRFARFTFLNDRLAGASAGLAVKAK